MPDKRKTAFIIFTFLLPLILIILFEIILRLFNYGGNTDLFIKDNTDKQRYVLNANFMQRYFFKEGIKPPDPRSQSFSVNKPRNTFRIFCLGASTTQGVPYPLHAAFPAQLDSLLEYANPNYDFEVINCGITAVTSHTVLDMAREIIASYQPDLLVVYSGHNEFYGIFGSASQTALFENRAMIQMLLQLQRLKTVLFLRNTLINFFGETVSNENVTDPNTLMGTLAKDAQIFYDSNTFKNTTDIFSGNIEDLAELSVENEVPLLLCNLVDNLKMAPFESAFSNKNPDVQEQINELLNEGSSLLKENLPNNALKFLNEALLLDSLFAKTHFLLGELYLQKNDSHAALKHFKKARDYDLIRFRAPSDFNRIIKNISEEKNIALADLENAFEQKSPDKIPGYELILEHIHPNYFGYFLMALAIAQQIENSQLLPVKVSNLNEVDSTLVNRFSNLTKLSHEVVNMGVFKLQQYWPFTEEHRNSYNRIGSELTEKLAREYVFNHKISLPQLHLDYGYKLFLNNNTEAAIKEFKTSFLIEPSCDALNNLGMAHAQLASMKTDIERMQDFNKSTSYFNRALKMCPENDDIYYNLGLAYSLMGDKNLKAAGAYAKVLEKNPNHQQALDRLISSYLILKEYGKAKNLLLVAVQRQPQNSEYFKHLGKIYLLEKDYNKARKAFMQANKLNPADSEVINFLNKMGS